MDDRDVAKLLRLLHDIAEEVRLLRTLLTESRDVDRVNEKFAASARLDAGAATTLERAEAAAERIIGDLRARYGFDELWDQVDSEYQDEIVSTWAGLIRDCW